jgi:hypothetical protein
MACGSCGARGHNARTCKQKHQQQQQGGADEDTTATHTQTQRSHHNNISTYADATSGSESSANRRQLCRTASAPAARSRINTDSEWSDPSRRQRGRRQGADGDRRRRTTSERPQRKFTAASAEAAATTDDSEAHPSDDNSFAPLSSGGEDEGDDSDGLTTAEHTTHTAARLTHSQAASARSRARRAERRRRRRERTHTHTHSDRDNDDSGSEASTRVVRASSQHGGDEAQTRAAPTARRTRSARQRRRPRRVGGGSSSSDDSEGDGGERSGHESRSITRSASARPGTRSAATPTSPHIDRNDQEPRTTFVRPGQPFDGQADGAANEGRHLWLDRSYWTRQRRATLKARKPTPALKAGHGQWVIITKYEPMVNGIEDPVYSFVPVGFVGTGSGWWEARRVLEMVAADEDGVTAAPAGWAVNDPRHGWSTDATAQPDVEHHVIVNPGVACSAIAVIRALHHAGVGAGAFARPTASDTEALAVQTRATLRCLQAKVRPSTYVNVKPLWRAVTGAMKGRRDERLPLAMSQQDAHEVMATIIDMVNPENAGTVITEGGDHDKVEGGAVHDGAQPSPTFHSVVQESRTCQGEDGASICPLHDQREHRLKAHGEFRVYKSDDDHVFHLGAATRPVQRIESDYRCQCGGKGLTVRESNVRPATILVEQMMRFSHSDGRETYNAGAVDIPDEQQCGDGSTRVPRAFVGWTASAGMLRGPKGTWSAANKAMLTGPALDGSGGSWSAQAGHFWAIVYHGGAWWLLDDDQPAAKIGTLDDVRRQFNHSIYLALFAPPQPQQPSSCSTQQPPAQLMQEQRDNSRAQQLLRPLGRARASAGGNKPTVTQPPVASASHLDSIHDEATPLVVHLPADRLVRANSNGVPASARVRAAGVMVEVLKGVVKLSSDNAHERWRVLQTLIAVPPYRTRQQQKRAKKDGKPWLRAEDVDELLDAFLSGNEAIRKVAVSRLKPERPSEEEARVYQRTQSRGATKKQRQCSRPSRSARRAQRARRRRKRRDARRSASPDSDDETTVRASGPETPRSVEASQTAQGPSVTVTVRTPAASKHMSREVPLLSDVKPFPTFASECRARAERDVRMSVTPSTGSGRSTTYTVHASRLSSSRTSEDGSTPATAQGVDSLSSQDAPGTTDTEVDERGQGGGGVDALADREDADVVVDKFDIELTAGDLRDRLLQPKGWLNDELINFYMSMITQRSAVIDADGWTTGGSYAFSSHLLTKLMNVSGGGKYDYASVKKWTTRGRVKVHLLDRAYFPLHRRDDSHWCMVKVDLKRRAMEYYDPYLTSDEEGLDDFANRALDAIDDFISDEYQQHAPRSDTHRRWRLARVRHRQNLPRQPSDNGWDCGMFSALFADQDSANVDDDNWVHGDSPLARRRMCEDMMAGELPQTGQVPPTGNSEPLVKQEPGAAQQEAPTEPAADHEAMIQAAKRQQARLVRAIRAARNGEYSKAVKLASNDEVIAKNAYAAMLAKHPPPCQRLPEPEDPLVAGLVTDDADALQQLTPKEAEAALRRIRANNTPSEMEPDKPTMGEWAAKAAHDVSKTSSPGIDSMSARALHQLLDTTPAAADAFGEYIFHLMLGRGPAEDKGRRALVGARLIAFERPGKTPRPIACGQLCRRIVAKVCCMWLRPSYAAEFGDTQMGVGVSGGIERVIHRTRHELEAHKEDDDFAVLFVDMANAFNSASRSRLRQLVARHHPWLSPWVEYCYARPSDLQHYDNIVPSQEGTQQGDPLGPFLFAVVLQLVVRVLQEDPSLDLNMWFLDDGTIGGKASALEKAMHILSSVKVTNLGLTVQPDKCWLVYPSRAAVLEVGDGTPPLHERLGVTADHVVYNGDHECLGSPIGTPAHCAAFLRDKALANAKVLAAIVAMGQKDLQVAVMLSRYCAGFCKINHLLRTVPPSAEFAEALSDFQTGMQSLWSDWVPTGLSDDQWTQMQLPTALGGVGVRNPAEHHVAAYTASLVTSMHAGNFEATEPHLTELAAELSSVMPTRDEEAEAKEWLETNADYLARLAKGGRRPRSQFQSHHLTEQPRGDADANDRRPRPLSAIDKPQQYLAARVEAGRLRRLLNSLVDKAESDSVKDPCYAQAVRLRGLLLPGAGAFLDARPTGVCYMGRGSMTMALAMRIGGSIGYGSAGQDAKCPLCVAGTRRRSQADASSVAKVKSPNRHSREVATLDALGTHALCSCMYGGDKTRRHNAVCDTVEAFGRMAKRSVLREVRGGSGPSKSRPGDVVFLNCGRKGTHVYTDVTLTYTGKPSKSYNITAGEDAEGDAKCAAAAKDIKHKSNVESESRNTFLPLAANHFGGWEARAAQFLKKLGKDASRAYDPRRVTSVFLFRELSVRIQNCNYDFVNNRRLPDHHETFARACGLAGDRSVGQLETSVAA